MLPRLMAIASAIRPSLPRIAAIIQCIEGTHVYAGFADLVGHFLPEQEDFILGQPTDHARVVAFAEYFGQRYFPLDGDAVEMAAWDGEELEYLTSRIPVDVEGAMDWSWHEQLPDFRLGMQLMTALTNTPYDGDIMHDEDGLEQAGGRVVLWESILSKLRGRARERMAALRGRVPAGGFAMERLRDCIGPGSPGEEYRAVYDMGCWWDNSTGIGLLDYSNEDPVTLDWSDGNVEAITEQWPLREAWHDRISQFCEWLEADPVGRFEEVLNAIEREPPRPRRPQPRRLVEIFAEEEAVDAA